MVYLVSYQIGRSVGHINLTVHKWASGEDTREVMEFIAKSQNANPDDVIITSVFKLPDSEG